MKTDIQSTDFIFKDLQAFLLHYTLQINKNQFIMTYLNSIGVIYSEYIPLQLDVYTFLKSLDYLEVFIENYGRGYRIYFYDNTYINSFDNQKENIENFESIYYEQTIEYFKSKMTNLSFDKSINDYIISEYYDYEPKFKKSLINYEFYTTGSIISNNRAIEISENIINISKNPTLMKIKNKQHNRRNRRNLNNTTNQK